MFNKILFATTASPTCDNAAKVAFDLELKWDAKLYVFHVLGIPSRGYCPFVMDARTGELEMPDPDYVDWVIEEMKNTYDVCCVTRKMWPSRLRSAFPPGKF